MGTLALVMWLAWWPAGGCADPHNTMYCPMGANGIIEAVVPVSPPEWKPLVVPAIHAKDLTFNEDTYFWDCEDKTRILEHDQQNPPKYWCRAEIQ